MGKTLAAEQVAEWEGTKGYSRLSFKEREAFGDKRRLKMRRLNRG